MIMNSKTTIKFTDYTGSEASIITYDDCSFLCPICGVRHLAAIGPPWTADGEDTNSLCPTCGIQSGHDDCWTGLPVATAWDRFRIEWLDNLNWHDFAIACQARLGFTIADLRRLQQEYEKDADWDRERVPEAFRQEIRKEFPVNVVPEGWAPGDPDPMNLW